jgi:hypothetical protein
VRSMVRNVGLHKPTMRKLALRRRRSTPNAARAPRVGVAEKSEKVSKHEEEEEEFEGDDDGLSPQQVQCHSCQQPSAAALPVPSSCAACMAPCQLVCLGSRDAQKAWSAVSWHVAFLLPIQRPS